MTDLTNKRCIPCEGGVPSLTPEEVLTYLSRYTHWQKDAASQTISREYKFKNFYQTMAFVNAVAWIANQENHHPDLEVGYNRCLVKYTTHAIGGLSENDFICAAKVDALGEV